MQRIRAGCDHTKSLRKSAPGGFGDGEEVCGVRKLPKKYANRQLHVLLAFAAFNDASRAKSVQNAVAAHYLPIQVQTRQEIAMTTELRAGSTAVRRRSISFPHGAGSPQAANKPKSETDFVGGVRQLVSRRSDQRVEACQRALELKRARSGQRRSAVRQSGLSEGGTKVSPLFFARRNAPLHAEDRPAHSLGQHLERDATEMRIAGSIEPRRPHRDGRLARRNRRECRRRRRSCPAGRRDRRIRPSHRSGRRSASPR